MGPVDGALARKLDFEEAAGAGNVQPRLRLAPSSGMLLRGPDKYQILAHRRHQAQIKARRLLELAEEKTL
jgi:hypothetical protein